MTVVGLLRIKHERSKNIVTFNPEVKSQELFSKESPSVGPDVVINCSPNYRYASPECNPGCFNIKSDAFQKALKVTTHLGYFLKKICHQEPSKIDQSGHAAHHGSLSFHSGSTLFLITLVLNTWAPIRTLMYASGLSCPTIFRIPLFLGSPTAFKILTATRPVGSKHLTCIGSTDPDIGMIRRFG